MSDQAGNLTTARHHFENDPFPAANGMRLVELTPGYAKTAMKIEDRHMNNVGTVHGGAIFTLAAFAFGAAAKTAGRTAFGVSTSLSFAKAARSGVLYAEANVVASSRRVSTSTVRVTDDQGQLIAVFQGTAYVTDTPFPPQANDFAAGSMSPDSAGG
jgi:acyl-CoA thioesterase